MAASLGVGCFPLFVFGRTFSSAPVPGGRDWGLIMKIEALRYGTTVVLREPTMDDVEDSLRFFKELPPEDRKYLRVDVTKRKNVEQRIKDSLEGRTYRIIALAGDKIIADGALEFSREDWSRHAGEIRAIVAHDYQRRGLGALLIKAIYGVAHQRGVEKLVAKMASPQTGARKTLGTTRLPCRLRAPGLHKGRER